MKVDWTLPSKECHDYNTGAWLRVIDTQDDKLLTNQYIYSNCLARNATVIDIIVHTNYNNTSADETDEDQKCRIELEQELEECKVYSVQIIPQYDSFQGQTQSTDIIVPPKVNSFIALKELLTEINYRSFIYY